jgi:hypothetical protein
MGASNALAAYSRFAGRIPASSLTLLTYMALVSKDSDAWPFCRLGQHALAEHALGRADPSETDLRAVQRAMKPLLDAGAVTVDRAGAQRADGNVTARYRLNLHDRADESRRDWEETPDGKRRVSDRRRDPQHPTKNGGDTRRKVTRHPTVFDETPDENRRPKEPLGDMRSDKTKEKVVAVTPTSHPSRASPPAEKSAPVIQLFPKPPDPPLPSTAWRSRRDAAADAIAESMARVEARRAAHQAQLAAGGEP